jgi:cell division GTPase FtsZ
MDPEEALRQLRELSNKVIVISNEPDLNEGDFETVFTTAVEMAEQFQALDNWISNGGFLPKDWKK